MKMRISYWCILLLLGTELISHIADSNKGGENISRVVINPRELVNINGSFYFISSISMTIYQAVNICNDLEMKLVSIQSEVKQQRIAQFLDTNGYDEQRFWTSGIRDYPSHYVWSGTGQRFMYTNWAPDFPNYKDNEPYISVAIDFKNESRKWFDERCYSSFNIICEENYQFN